MDILELTPAGKTQMRDAVLRLIGGDHISF
jgi:hypothetical protein